MTSAEWLASTSTSRQVLAIVSNIRETHIGWTRVGATTAYGISWSSQTHPGQAKSAYRLLTGVRLNSSDLTPQASLAAVQATPSSWFWDSATSTLYVATASGASPDSFSWIGSVFTLYFATTAVADAVLYEPRLTGALPTLTYAEPDLTVGLSSSASGSLTLVNADGFFDDLAWRYVWTNAVAQIRVGGGEMALADYLDAGTLCVVGPPAPADDVCVMQLRSFDNAVLGRAFPKHSFNQWFGDATPASLSGQMMPMIFGSVLNAPTFLIDDTAGTAAVLYVDPTMEIDFSSYTVSAVYAFDRTTGAATHVPASDYLSGGGILSINSVTWPVATYDFRVDVAHNSTNAVGTLMQQLINGMASFSAIDIDTSAFDQADLDCPAVLGLYVAGGPVPQCFVSLRDLIQQLERSTLTRIAFGADGQWTIDVFNPTIDIDAPTLREELMTVFRPTEEADKVIAEEVVVRYAQRVGAQTWSVATATAGADRYAHQSTESLPIETVLTTSHDATILAERLAWLCGVPSIRVEIDGPPDCFALMPRDKVRVMRSRAPGTTGAWPDPGASMEIESVSKRPSDCRASVTVGNLRGTGGAVKQCAPNGTPAWDSASGLERATYIYALDNATQRVDTADASTYQQNRAW